MKKQSVVAVVGTAVSLVAVSASAALPEAVTTAMDTAIADVGEAQGLVFLAVLAFVAFGLVLKAIKRH